MKQLSGAHIRSALRRAITPPTEGEVPPAVPAAPYRGHVDGFHHGALVGWVVRGAGQGDPITVGLFTEDGFVASAKAVRERRDVIEAGICDWPCGFEFPLTESLRELVAATNGHLRVCVLDETMFELGTAEIPTEQTIRFDDSDPRIAHCGKVLQGDLKTLMRRLDQVGEIDGPLPVFVPPLCEPHRKMFSTTPLLGDLAPSGQPAYLDYVRYRYRMERTYDVGPGLDSSDHFLHWYLTNYRATDKRRVPLSADLVDYLNEPVVMGGQRFSLSRIMWWRLMGYTDMLARLNLNNRDAYIALVFWWVHNECPRLGFEDCLVPDRFADLMRGVHPSRRDGAYPLSYFLAHFFEGSPQFHFLNPASDNGRQLLVLSLMVQAVRRPDMLRYVPHRSISALLTPREDGVSDFERFVTALSGGEPVRISRDRYAAVMRRSGYDMLSQRFMARTIEGHRLEAAALSLPDSSLPEVDVQLIGPLAKASGLGQAARLSAAILRETGLSVRGVDFDLDNPAPVGFSTDTLIEDYGPSKINLIHLNAESVPLAFAYQPDVFSGHYNIGYFYWELDRPAWCHYLGMELLDEIWVSTDYGVEIYRKDAKGKPVVNVGMCFEDMPGIERADARDFVNRRFQLDDTHYVCLVAFDSFSFVQRKNPVTVLKAFQKAFEGVENARLVVKTQNRDSIFDPLQVQIWDRVEAIIASDHRIVVMNETLPYRDVLRLKAGSDCYISLHKSEGWGFGMIEAMGLGVPVVCTAYSGNMDFCKPGTAWLVDYQEIVLQPDDYIFVRKGSKWAEPDLDAAARALRAAYDDPAERKVRAAAALTFIRQNFTQKAISARYGERLREILKTLQAGK